MRSPTRATPAGPGSRRPARGAATSRAAALLFAALASLTPAVAEAAQIPSQAARPLPGPHAPGGTSGTLAHLCAGSGTDEDGVLAEIAGALSLPDHKALRAALLALELDARRQAALAPLDLDSQYRLAAVLGARAEAERGLPKVRAALDLHPQVLRVLEMSPGHPGASYILGRLHAGVLRVDPVTRFIAVRLLGAAALARASWETAVALMELAEREEPCAPDTHYELARAYLDVGNAEAAWRERAHVLELTAGREGRWAPIRARAERLQPGGLDG